jgi:hypothetical protein
MTKNIIDTNFNFYSDARGGDPDSTSPTLKNYHKLLWSKSLPNGSFLELNDDLPRLYLYHKSELGEFRFGSDAIVHSYRKHKRKEWLTKQIPEDVGELFNSCCNIGSYIIFPKNRIDGKQTINQARGVNRLIDDRFDLTLECIRRFYKAQPSPLYATLMRYKDFFQLFNDFNGYIDFFFLQDLVDEKNHQIKFYLPFDDFKTPPLFSNTADYLFYKKGVISFNSRRKLRIEEYSRLWLQ